MYIGLGTSNDLSRRKADFESPAKIAHIVIKNTVRLLQIWFISLKIVVTGHNLTVNMTVFSDGMMAKNGVVKEGSNVTIICSAAYSNKEAFYLFEIVHYNNSYNKAEERFDVITNSSHVSYTISSITMDQFGKYVCGVLAAGKRQYQVWMSF